MTGKSSSLSLNCLNKRYGLSWTWAFPLTLEFGKCLAEGIYLTFSQVKSDTKKSSLVGNISLAQLLAGRIKAPLGENCWEPNPGISHSLPHASFSSGLVVSFCYKKSQPWIWLHGSPSEWPLEKFWNLSTWSPIILFHYFFKLNTILHYYVTYAEPSVGLSRTS